MWILGLKGLSLGCDVPVFHENLFEIPRGQSVGIIGSNL